MGGSPGAVEGSEGLRAAGAVTDAIAVPNGNMSEACQPLGQGLPPRRHDGIRPDAEGVQLREVLVGRCGGEEGGSWLSCGLTGSSRNACQAPKPPKQCVGGCLPTTRAHPPRCLPRSAAATSVNTPMTASNGRWVKTQCPGSNGPGGPQNCSVGGP